MLKRFYGFLDHDHQEETFLGKWCKDSDVTALEAELNRLKAGVKEADLRAMTQWHRAESLQGMYFTQRDQADKLREMAATTEAELEATKALLQVRTEALEDTMKQQCYCLPAEMCHFHTILAMTPSEALALKHSEAAKQTPKGEQGDTNG